VLAWTALPAPFRLRLWEKVALIVITAMVVGMGAALTVTSL
jgi:hypothetical protein